MDKKQKERELFGIEKDYFIVDAFIFLILIISFILLTVKMY